MNSSQTHIMFNPFDGALFATAGVGSFFLGLITGNSPVVAAVASACVMGIFALIAKGMQIGWESYKDRRLKRALQRIAELEAQSKAGQVTRQEADRYFAERLK